MAEVGGLEGDYWFWTALELFREGDSEESVRRRLRGIVAAIMLKRAVYVDDFAALIDKAVLKARAAYVAEGGTV